MYSENRFETVSKPRERVNAVGGNEAEVRRKKRDDRDGSREKIQKKKYPL